MKTTASKSGGVLVMVMVIILTIGFLSMGMMQMHKTDAVESVRIKQAMQAFWLADTGVQAVVSELRNDKGSRGLTSTVSSSPSILSNSVGSVGSYSVEYWSDFGYTNFTIRSLGTVRAAQRLLEVDMTVGDIGDHSLITLNGDSVIRKDCTINGSVYQNGELSVAGGVNISGTVYADNYEDFGTGTPIPEDGELDLSINDVYYFAPYFASPNSGTVSDPLVLTNQPGNTLVVSSGINVAEIVGPGTIVVKGDQVFSSDLIVDDDVSVIVDGVLKVQKNATFGNNVILYSTDEMDLFKNATSDVNTGTGCAFLSLGDMKIKKELTFDGLIFSEGTITADKDLSVTGTMITEDGFVLKKDATVTFDASVIPDDVREFMIISTYIVYNSSWKEIPVY